MVFIGSVSSQGNKGQLSYAVSKAGLEGAAATLMKEAIFHGVRCGVIHPGFTDTPMVRALGEEYINKNILPYTQLRRLIRPQEIADAICFLISNSAVSGELWADAARRERSGAAARAWVVEHHSWETAARTAAAGLEKSLRGE